jgi:hypothetical protein
MEWNKVIANRRNTYSWLDKVPDKSLVDQIVQELHDYCPSKQRKVPFYLDIIENTDFNNDTAAYEFLLSSKDQIRQEAVSFIEKRIAIGDDTFINYVYDQSKCLRDVGYVVSSYANDLRYNTNKSTIEMARGYWLNGKPQIRRFAEVPVHRHLKEFIVNQASIYNVNQLSINRIESLCDIIINVIEHGIETLPEEMVGTGNLRYDIFRGTDRKGQGFASDIRNPQVLAPYVLVFSQRDLSDNEIGLNTEMHDPHKARNVSENEIGLASMFVTLSAAAKGLDTGFCACIRNGDDIAKRLGHKGPVLLYVGLGYSSTKKQYFNPIVHETMDIPDSNYDQKPSLETYYKFVSA